MKTLHLLKLEKLDEIVFSYVSYIQVLVYPMESLVPYVLLEHVLHHHHVVATVGEVGNEDSSLVKVGKAGRNRYKGIRPTVRGSSYIQVLVYPMESLVPYVLLEHVLHHHHVDGH